MASRKSPGLDTLTADDLATVRELLGHLNFSGGKRDVAFLKRLNWLWERLPVENQAEALRTFLVAQLTGLEGSTPAFQDVSQARSVIELTLTTVLNAYRKHHADLLFHLTPAEFEQPFLIGCLFEAVLVQGAPWDDPERIVSGALAQVNDFVGYRPVAVLENERKMEVYDHEKFRPVPIFIEGAGVAAGKYHELIEHTFAFLKDAPADLLEEAHFKFGQMEELAVDVRAHDHLHPVNKRTNYMFGEWDPHHIDVRGKYRRFILRKVILDALVTWVDDAKAKPSREERLFDAAAALCGTMLMASSISGDGPQTHDSNTSLTSLLPIVARRRDAFYARLMQQVTGTRLKRLRKEEERTQQPFGHVRQFLNMHLAGYGARQIQHRELAYLYARMGYPEAGQRQAAAIPAASIRFECEIQSRITSAQLLLSRGRLDEAAGLIFEFDGLVHRGIECGALVDPWNILGFQGQFPLFHTREDVIPDNRVETLLELLEGVFNVYARAIGEAAAQGNGVLRERLSAAFRSLTDWWDQFASYVIEDLPRVQGHESWESASRVAEVLKEWRAAGEAAGDVGFWRQQLEKLESAQSYALVVDALITKNDHVASMALLMQWLSQLDQAGVESTRHSIYSSLIRWMKTVTTRDAESFAAGGRSAVLRRLFAYLESNAEDYWVVPRMERAIQRAQDKNRPPERPQTETPGREDEDDEDNLFGAAYDEVTFRDSADDGNWGDTLENDYGFRNTEFELINRDMEPRLKFLNAVAQLWQMAAVAIVADAHKGKQGELSFDEPTLSAIRDWHQQTQRWQIDLAELMEGVWDHEIAAPSGEHDANVEYDIQLQVKFYLLHQIIATLICLRNGERLLSGCLPPKPDAPPKTDHLLSETYRAIIRRDPAAVRKLLPDLLVWLEKHPLLYIPFENGGEPSPILEAQAMQSVVRFLLRELPRLGLLRETYHVLHSAYRMERKWRPQGQAITEFDRLFDISLRHSLEAAVLSVNSWRVESDAAKSERAAVDDLIDAVGEIVEPYQQLWLEHSRTMRISAVDGLRNEDDWEELAEFIQSYGGDLFHASQLTLGNVRAILHNGIDWYIDYLEEEQDPLKPMRLLEDLDSGALERSEAEWALEQIYSIVVDKFDRFLEYNTTTTQSDYGEMFYCLLEFLRLEARYDRDSWNMQPVTLVHEVLARLGHPDAAELWESTYETQTRDLAEQHLKDLRDLQQRYGMRMPTIVDHLNQRFIKPLAVNRMVALVNKSVDDAREGEPHSAAFAKLQEEVDTYLEDSWGSGVDIPAWLRALEKEVHDATDHDEGGRPGTDADLNMPPHLLSPDEFRAQLRDWETPVIRGTERKPERRTRKGRTQRGRHRRKPPEDPK
jgi:hypothetical protein